MTFGNLRIFATTEPSKYVNATKEQKDEIIAALAAISQAGIDVPDDARPFDSEVGQIAKQFRDYLKSGHLMAICGVKM